MTWSYDRRRRVVALWVAALVTATVLASVAGGDTEGDLATMIGIGVVVPP